jgi:hypothetical protein
MNFKDTQCGAKVFHKDVVPISFDKNSYQNGFLTLNYIEE